MNLAGFEYIFKKGTSSRTLLLLHGTGGNERNMIPLGESLDAEANLLSVRGNVMENGMLRFFRRESPGVFDMKDLEARTKELFKFLEEAAKVHELPLTDIIGVGYSNGANVLLYSITQGHKLGSYILLRPMSAAITENEMDLTDMRIFIAVGLLDEMTPPKDYKIIEQALKRAQADVTTYTSNAGHGLTQEDISAARDWLTV